MCRHNRSLWLYQLPDRRSPRSKHEFQEIGPDRTSWKSWLLESPMNITFIARCLLGERVGREGLITIREISSLLLPSGVGKPGYPGGLIFFVTLFEKSRAVRTRRDPQSGGSK